MSADTAFDVDANYKKYYAGIFSTFYFFQGIHQAIPAILPYYLLFVFGEFNIALLALISAISMIPWSVKFIVGLINDRWGSERFGRRFPFVFIFGCVGGATWIVTAFFLPLDQRIYYYFAIYLLVSNIGVAVADTSIDGMILDVVPKSRLAKVQGYTWSMLMVGNAAAAGIGLLFYLIGIIPVLFLITGIGLIASVVWAYFITEPPLKTELHIVADLKRLVLDKKNWIIYAWTVTTAMTYVIIIGAFYYYMFFTMGVIDITEANLSLETGQTTEGYIVYGIFVSGAAGIGIVLGSLVLGRIADKGRRFSVNFVYAIYLPFCFLSILFVGFYLGLVAELIFGFISGSILIAGQTLRGDIAKRSFPDLKSTYYALLVSLTNLGQSIGSLILAYLFASTSKVISDFFVLYFLITLITGGLVIISYALFRSINPLEYEFEDSISVKG